MSEDFTNKIIYHEWEGGIENSIPRITVWHHEACRLTELCSIQPSHKLLIFFLYTTKNQIFII